MRPKILVVDDSPTIRAQIVSELHQGYECVTATNGREALALAFEDPPDAAIIDLEMPGMGGIELLGALKTDNRTRETPVVIVTTVTAVDKMNQCRASGCSGFVLKPVNGDYLRAKLKQLLSK